MSIMSNQVDRSKVSIIRSVVRAAKKRGYLREGYFCYQTRLADFSLTPGALVPMYTETLMSASYP
jgi:hypothetical protein